MRRSIRLVTAGAAFITFGSLAAAAQDAVPAGAPRTLTLEDHETVKYPGIPVISRDGKLVSPARRTMARLRGRYLN